MPRIAEPHRCDEVSWHPRHRLPATVLPYLPAVLADLPPPGRLTVIGW